MYCPICGMHVEKKAYCRKTGEDILICPDGHVTIVKDFVNY